MCSSDLTRREGGETVVISTLENASHSQRFIHLVNYNRTEPPKGAPRAGRGPQEEKPIAAENIRVMTPLPAGKRVKSVRLISPDRDVATGEIKFELGGTATQQTLSFTVPRMLVYTVAEVEFQ